MLHHVPRFFMVVASCQEVSPLSESMGAGHRFSFPPLSCQCPSCGKMLRWSGCLVDVRMQNISSWLQQSVKR